MTIREVISQTDELFTNAFSDEQKMKWLHDIENKIYKEIVLTHHHHVEMTDFDDDSNELIAPSPYDNLYTSYLLAQVFKYSQETVRYNNAMIIFNQEYQEFANYYNRKTMPITKKRKGVCH